jgi:hypothetical protein
MFRVDESERPISSSGVGGSFSGSSSCGAPIPSFASSDLRVRNHLF